MSGCGKPYDPEDMVDIAHWAHRQPPSPKLAGVLKPYLQHPRPYFRHQAAKILLLMGDTSGVPALVAMVNSPGPLMDYGIDLRLLAPSTLVDFDQVSAADAVVALYLRLRADRNYSDAAGARRSAARLGARQIIPYILEDAQRELWPNDFEDLGVLHSTEGNELMRGELTNPRAPRYRREAVKVAAAWALARSGEIEPHTHWLMEEAKPWVDAAPSEHGVLPGRDINRTDWRAFEHLEGLHGPAVQKFFENALESKHPEVLKASLIYLRLNHPDSKLGRDKLLALTRSNLPGVSWTLLDCLAWHSRDPEIEAASIAKYHEHYDRFYVWAQRSAPYRNLYLGNHRWKQ